MQRPPTHAPFSELVPAPPPMPQPCVGDDSVEVGDSATTVISVNVDLGTDEA